jgi:NitT/TauT family transport system substrate-binding protein
MKSLFAKSLSSLAVVLAFLASTGSVQAADKVRVGVFPVSSSLPFFVAQERGYFAAEGIETEAIRLIGGPPHVAALIGNQIDVSANLVTIEGMNANLLRSGVAMFISLNSQNTKHQMEQFVVRKGYKAKTISDLRGARIFSAPGPANFLMARAALAANGLKEGEYTLDQLDMGHHVSVMQAGTFDAGYTLEPNATSMRNLGVADTLETGVIARYILGDPNANAFVAGAAMSSTFIESRPDVARRFAAAWSRALADIAKDPTVRKHLLKNTFTPEDVVDTIPMIRFVMVNDLTDAEKKEFQTFIDWTVKNKILEKPIDTSKFLKGF